MIHNKLINGNMGKNSILAVALFIIITLIYFHKVFFGLVPVPFDIVIGGYYPWVDYKWGYIIGVPVKNAVLSDVSSQIYPWKDLVMEMIKNRDLPLWNPYTFSGAPLLANWQSAPFYPLNLLMLPLETLTGWSILIMLQPLLAMLFMYLYLKQISIKNIPAIAGAVVFAFAGFMTTYLEYGTTGQIFLWLPLLLLVIEKFYQTRKIVYLTAICFICYPILTAGFFQPALYALGVAFLYFIARSINEFESSPFKRSFQASLIKEYYGKSSLLFIKSMFFGILAFTLGIALAAVQLLPTAELLSNSFRNNDANIVEYGYGLLPLRNALTFISPDFFGNNVTLNFWGVIGYQETSGYFGVIPLILLVSALINYRKNFYVKFFGILFVISLLFIFASPLSKSVYLLKLPLVSTGYASRLLLITDIAAAVLVAFGLNNYHNRVKQIFRINSLLMLLIGAILLYLILQVTVFAESIANPGLISKYQIALKNTLVPAGLVAVCLFILKFVKKEQLVVLALTLLITIDLFRYSSKFTPFSPAAFNYPTTPVIDFLKSNIGFHRVEREKSEVLPPNSWISYRLMSPSGYDPLYPKSYAAFYSVYGGNLPGDGFSRYAESDNYNSPILDLAGVKYLVAAKRDKDNVIYESSGALSDKISDPKFKRVFEDKSLVVLENSKVMPRAVLFDQYDVVEEQLSALKLLHGNYDFYHRVILKEVPSLDNLKIGPGDKAEIVDYQPNKVTISTKTDANALMMLTDTDYPGWQAKIDGRPTRIMLADGVFRAVVVPAGLHQVTFAYDPQSFQLGLKITLASLLLSAGLLIMSFRRRWEI